MLTRFRTFAILPLDPALTERLTISWAFVGGDLPSDVDTDRMVEFEDIMVQTLERGDFGRLAFVRTYAGVRQWIFYVRAGSDLSARINTALSDYPNLPLRLELAEDADWIAYTAVLQGCSSHSRTSRKAPRER